jgi:hypothetical protein
MLGFQGYIAAGWVTSSNVAHLTYLLRILDQGSEKTLRTNLAILDSRQTERFVVLEAARRLYIHPALTDGFQKKFCRVRIIEGIYHVAFTPELRWISAMER